MEEIKEICPRCVYRKDTKEKVELIHELAERNNNLQSIIDNTKKELKRREKEYLTNMCHFGDNSEPEKAEAYQEILDYIEKEENK